ncbi:MULTISPECIES: hypothetical protein [Streptomyces]|uniref:hypothetical protein n=1 Tax=Streptomyces TaxID=1883 RepID=UPI0022495884|nr:hypothetical protein [Streptomyces sp. JHD 1]MCX2967855.1 hypothetical protein [Streptomyces sp. JHD 1]
MGAETKRANKPSTGGKVAAGLGLVLLDLLAIAVFLWGYLITGWADNWSQDNAPEAPQAARQAMWFLAGGAVVTGGGLLALGRRAYGIVQLLTLGGAAAAFALLATL